jgi:DNA invertase Pin-like site-specific DNA recombinase
MQRHVAIYVRVSGKAQDTRSQQPDLDRWAAAHADGLPVQVYRDTFTGKTMDRPGWQALEQAIQRGLVATVVVWRLDRLGRTAKGLTALFEDLIERKVNLVSMKEHLDLATPAGRLMAVVMAGVAAYETEIRAERVTAGQAVARAKGKRWGGSKPGVRKKVTPTQVTAIHALKAQGAKVAAIAKALGLSRPTVYDVLAAEVAPC